MDEREPNTTELDEAQRQEALQALDAKLAEIQELLQRMENLAQLASRPECTPPRRARLQGEFDRLKGEIDRVADSLWVQGNAAQEAQ